jgi:hypothetical protein
MLLANDTMCAPSILINDPIVASITTLLANIGIMILHTGYMMA